jgi:hypothetical protein
MKHKLFILLVSLLTLCVSSCKTALVGPNPIQKQCIQACVADFNYCRKICVKDCFHCCAHESVKARTSLSRYVRQCRIEGKVPLSRLQSFSDPLKCNKNSCNCQDDLVLCKQTCLGKVYKSLKPYKFC